MFGILQGVLQSLGGRYEKSFMAGFLYLGAGLGMIPLCFVKNKSSSIATRKITRQDLPYIIGMVTLDIAAPIFLMTATQQ